MCRIALAFVVGGMLLSSAAVHADNLYGLFNHGDSGAGDSLTLARIDVATGNATPLLNYVTSHHGFGGGLAFDKASNQFVTVGSDGTNKTMLVIDAFSGTPTWTETPVGLPAAFTDLYGVEYVPSGANTTNSTLTDGLYVSYGPHPSNHNQNDRIAKIDVATGAVLEDVTSHSGLDMDSLAYDPDTKFLIITDSNNSPLEAISGNIFSSPTYPTYASPADNGELYDGAFSPNVADFGTFYAGLRETSTLWKLNDSGTDYDFIGPFNMGGALPAGLAFAVPEPATAGLFALGLALSLLTRRRRARKR